MNSIIQVPAAGETFAPPVESTAEKLAAQSDGGIHRILQFSIGSFSVADLVQILVTLLVVHLLLKYLVASVRVALGKTALDKGIVGFVVSTLKGLIYISGLTVILEAFGIPATQLVAVIGILGLAISLSIQNFMTNVMSGITILVAKPYQVGDFVEAEGSSGEVKSIGLLYTELLSIEQKVHFIPNSLMASKRLINYSKNNTRKMDCTISISYESNLELAKSIILHILQKDLRVYKNPEPLVRLKAFGSSSIDLVVRAVVDTSLYMDVLYDFNEALFGEFNKAGISFAYPHMDVTMVGERRNSLESLEEK